MTQSKNFFESYIWIGFAMISPNSLCRSSGPRACHRRVGSSPSPPSGGWQHEPRSHSPSTTRADANGKITL
eukprot:918767-Amphidinium_carterae.1